MLGLDPTAGTVGERRVASHKLPLVNMRYQGHAVGLYGIREVGSNTLVLHPGPTCLPVGTQVVLEDLFGLIPGIHPSMVPATIIKNGARGLTLGL